MPWVAFSTSLSASQCHHSIIKWEAGPEQTLCPVYSRHQDSLYYVPPSKFNTHRNKITLMLQCPQIYPSVLLILLCFRLQDLDGCISEFSPPPKAALPLIFLIIKTLAPHRIQELSNKNKTKNTFHS